MYLNKIEWDGMGNQWNYICPSCNHKCTIEPPGRNGVILAVTCIVLTFFAFLNATSDSTDWITWAIWGTACAVSFYFPLAGIYLQRKYPITGRVEIDVESDALNDPLQKGIEQVEKLSFWQGLMVPIAFIAFVLGAALLVGLVLY